tara:strand:- start:381 stop:554 length:174 start_codon:yes stop_codon:yes gene_type:complete
MVTAVLLAGVAGYMMADAGETSITLPSGQSYNIVVDVIAEETDNSESITILGDSNGS